MGQTKDKEKTKSVSLLFKTVEFLSFFSLGLCSLRMPLYSLDALITKGHGFLSYMNLPSSHILQT